MNSACWKFLDNVIIISQSLSVNETGKSDEVLKLLNKKY